MYRSLLALTLLPALAHAQNGPPLLLQHPAVSAQNVAFSYAGDLWIVERSGGQARRLTAGVGLESYPVFSPDGAQIAFAGEYEGNLDVYVIPSAGGQPRRLTHHPDPDVPVAWTPDGQAVLFRSTRSSHARFIKLFSVPVGGGQPTELPVPMGEEGTLSPDGKHLAYVPLSNRPQFPGAFRPVRNYRGGTASAVWIADLADSTVVKVPRTDSNDFNPMWIGDKVYFLSDRNGPTTIFVYEPATKEVRRVLAPGEADIKSASAGLDAIVFDSFGSLYLFDLKSQLANPIPVQISADIPGVRPRIEKAAKHIRAAKLSPTGVRAVFEARGEILTVPADKGDPRNLTNSPGVAERDPAWSPDGKSLAYFSDESGEYDLHIRAQDGRGSVKKLKLGDAPSFYYNPVWSPDGNKIAYQDKRLNVWIMDVESGKSTKADTGPYDDDPPAPVVWSPDSKWLAYSRSLKNYLFAVFIYSLGSGKAHQVTDGMSDARFAAFDPNGKYLYFTASTDIGPSVGSGMSALNRGVSRGVYALVLNKNDASPLAPESDDEKPKPDKEKVEAAKGPPAVKIDTDDMDQRIIALPVPARNYVGLFAGKAGSFFLLEGPALVTPDDATLDPSQRPATVLRFDLAKRKTDTIAERVLNATASADGQKLLFEKGGSWFVGSALEPVKPADAPLKLDGVEIRIDPKEEWRQIYRDVYRIERDFLYDPGFHGFNLSKAWVEHEKYLEGLGSRHELNYLLDELLAGLSLQHVYLRGGDVPLAESRKCGLLGADFRVENGRHRITRVYRGESWNPELRAPLTQPGANVKAGEYLLSVNGHDMRGEDEVYRVFEGTAGKQTLLSVGPKADGKNSREVLVVPVPSERALRNLAWVDANRKAVDKATGGRVAYVYLPDTFAQGFTRFNRYFFAQAGREAAIVDERFNGGGMLADHVIDYLRQPIRNYASTREGADQAFPGSAIPGPKVMLINEQAGSGGDYLPYTFRQAGLGTLVGKRTWGGLVGISGYPTLMDGGTITAPRWGIWFPNGRWDVENRGVAPDVEVEFDPKVVRQGHDPQLEKAIAIVLDELEKHPVKTPARPAYPDYYKPGVKSAAEGK